MARPFHVTMTSIPPGHAPRPVPGRATIGSIVVRASAPSEPAARAFPSARIARVVLSLTTAVIASVHPRVCQDPAVPHRLHLWIDPARTRGITVVPLAGLPSGRQIPIPDVYTSAAAKAIDEWKDVPLHDQAHERVGRIRCGGHRASDAPVTASCRRGERSPAGGQVRRSSARLEGHDYMRRWQIAA